MKPIIGITPSPSDDSFRHGTFHRYALASTYVAAVEAAGGVPIILPPQHGNVDEVLSVIDGLLLSGGGDIRPDRYGDDQVHPTTYGIDDLRDEFEIALVRAAIAGEIPVLCICRGIQVLNVALGGTLVQDIADQLTDEIHHAQAEIGIPRQDPSHAVQVEPDSRLAAIYGDDRIEANSFHHQALKQVSPNLKVVAHSPDGIVEAVEGCGSSWVLGVQWHPEMMFEAHAEHRRPLEALVSAAIEQRLGASVAQNAG
jgi:putative glutamine amidotransferase